MATLRPTFHSTSQVFWIVAFGFQSECSCDMKKHVRNMVIIKAFITNAMHPRLIPVPTSIAKFYVQKSHMDRDLEKDTQQL